MIARGSWLCKPKNREKTVAALCNIARQNVLLRKGKRTFLVRRRYQDRVSSIRLLGSAIRTRIAAASAREIEELGRKVPLLSLPVRIPAR